MRTTPFSDACDEVLDGLSAPGFSADMPRLDCRVRKAMMVSANMKARKNFELVARGFADASSSRQDVMDIGAVLNAVLKQIAAKLMSGRLIYTDHVIERGTTPTNTKAWRPGRSGGPRRGRTPAAGPGSASTAAER